MELREWIEANCLEVGGNITSWTGNVKWWDNRSRERLNELIEATNYLSDDAPICSRLVHFLKYATGPKSCERCGKPVKWRITLKSYEKKFCTSLCGMRDEATQSRRMVTVKRTLMEKYGVDNISKVPEIKAKISKALTGKKYVRKPGVLHHNQKHYDEKRLALLDNPTEIYKQHLAGRSINSLAAEMNVHPPWLHSILHKHGLRAKRHAVTESQLKLIKGIRELGIEHVVNDRTIIKPNELDVYVPELKLGIEVNGMFWHSNDKYRHVSKLERCEEIGVRLMQFTDHQINHRFVQMMQIIRTACGLNERVGARECLFDPNVPSAEYRDFVEANHLQGYAAASVRLGLRAPDGKLLQVMGFSKDRFSRGSDRWELVRLCTLSGVSVTGGAARLFDKRPAGPAFAYCQRDHFTGKVYAELGMTMERVTGPGYSWFRNGEVVTRYRAQKHKLRKLLGGSFMPEFSEDANMRLAGWRKYYDCGCQVWITS